MRARQRQQRELFVEERKPPEVPAQLRSAIVRLLEGLLVEALNSGGTQPAATPEIREAAHEQDHA